jgi:hypothetical protein
LGILYGKKIMTCHEKHWTGILKGRRRGSPRMTWRRTIDEATNRMGKSWKTAKELSRNTVRRQNLTEALCSTQDLQGGSSNIARRLKCL